MRVDGSTLAGTCAKSFGGELKSRNGDGEKADAAHALPGLVLFSTTAEVESRPRRGGSRTAATNADLPLLASWIGSASNSIKVDQMFWCSSLRNQVILQQAERAWGVLSGTSPAHLRLLGLDEKDVLGASSSCLPLRLPACTRSQTHTHFGTHTR